MSGSGVPPQGFRWVESGGGEPPSRPARRRRWWWVAAVIVVVLAVVAGGVLWWQHSTSRGSHEAAHTAAPKPAPIGTPKDRLIGFPLNREPVPSWHLSTSDIGLPPGFRTGTFLAAIGEKAFFVSGFYCDEGGGCKNPTGAVYGINTRTGAVLFVTHLTGFFGIAESCYLNGPSTAVCVNPECPKVGSFCYGLQRVWVIDLDHGAVTYTSDAPQVHATGNETELYAIGNHQGEARLVAMTKGKGIYGVGPHAEPTWFLPGSGIIDQANYLQVDDIPPLTLAVQRSADQHSYHVFSVDGKDLTPTPPEGSSLRDAQVYSGGYMYEYVKGNQAGGILLYDTDGALVADIPGAAYPQRNVAMPTFLGGGTQIYTADGKHLSSLPGGGLYYRTISTTLFSGGSLGYGSWQQFDILTGRPGPACEMDLSSYVASDGATLIWLHRDWDADIHAYVATEMATCQSLWEIPFGTAILRKAGTNLLQIADDTLTGLQAPA